jgi:flagella basal body P-ring formation protein FlgA
MLSNEYKQVSASKGIVFTYFCIASTVLLLSSTNVHANVNKPSMSGQRNSAHNTNSHQHLERQLLSFIEDAYAEKNPNGRHEVRINVRKIDERINIPQCLSGYAFDNSNSPENQSSMSVKVSCNDTEWFLFMHANVSVIQDVVVTSDNLSPGSLLSAHNVKVVQMDKNRLRGSTFSSIEEVVGARIKRRTRTDNVIDGRMLCFICKGDRVTIAAISSGLSIKVYGIAEQDGVVGDTIQVRNLSSDRLVFARIASTSQVEIRI